MSRLKLKLSSLWIVSFMCQRNKVYFPMLIKWKIKVIFLSQCAATKYYNIEISFHFHFLKTYWSLPVLLFSALKFNYFCDRLYFINCILHLHCTLSLRLMNSIHPIISLLSQRSSILTVMILFLQAKQLLLFDEIFSQEIELSIYIICW